MRPERVRPASMRDCSAARNCVTSRTRRRVPTVHPNARHRTQEKGGDLARKTDHAQKQGRAGQTINQPARREPRHPCADQGNALAAKEQTEIAVAQSAESVNLHAHRPCVERGLAFAFSRAAAPSTASARRRFSPSRRAAEKSSRRYDGARRRPGLSSHPRPASRCSPDRRRSCCRFHADARRDARQHDLGYAALAQVIVQCAQERAPPLLGDLVIVGVLLQFRNKLGPIGRKRKLGRPASVRPGAAPVTLTRTTGRPRSRKARASWAARSTISPAGCTVGKPTTPFCRSITTRRSVVEFCERHGSFPFMTRHFLHQVAS